MNQEAKTAKIVKPKSKPSTESLRVKRETKKKILSDLGAINKKDFGRKINVDQFVSLAISLVTPEHIEKLKQTSLTPKDHFELKYQEHCKAHGKVSKDDFLAAVLQIYVDQRTPGGLHAE